MFKDDNTFWGVYSPKGVLEHVEGSRDAAEATAANMSPDKQRPNRVVAAVTVVCGQVVIPDPAQLDLEGIVTATKRRINADEAEFNRMTGEAIRRAKIKAQDPANGTTSI